MRYRGEARSPRDNARSYRISRPFYDYGKASWYGGSHPTPGNRTSWPRQRGLASDSRQGLGRVRAFVRFAERCWQARLTPPSRTAVWPAAGVAGVAVAAGEEVDDSHHLTALFVSALMRLFSFVEASTRRWPTTTRSSSPSPSSSSVSLVVRLPLATSV